LSEAMARLPTLQPDLVLLDASIFDGLAFVRRIHQMAPHVLVVVLALTETAENVVAWAEAGAVGYIPKTAGLEDVLPTLLGIRRGEQICSPSVAAGLIRRVRELPVGSRASGHTKPLPALTAREQQIIELISAGLSNKEIARRLNIGVATTKSHVHNLLAKLKVQHRSHAAIRMREHAIIATIPAQLVPPGNVSRVRHERSGSENSI
jgi:DNA-binding NarL/FixJ family response regulator